MPLLELRQVTKSYREPAGQQTVSVLRGVNLTLNAGESVAIVGPSGCGKSTLLNVLGTLDDPDSGEMFFDGLSLQGATPAKLAALRSEKIGFIFQLHHLLPQCTTLENVLLPTLALKQKPDMTAARKRAADLLGVVGLGERLDWRPGQLSGGERQRVAFVRALINNPKMILADEPTGALDENNSQILTDLLLALVEKFGIALVLVSHNPQQAQRMKRVLRLHDGNLSTFS